MLYFQYSLTVSEISETLLCLNWKREGLFKKVNIGIMTILCIFLIFFYAKNPEYVFIAFIIILIISSMFFIVYMPRIFRNIKAKKIAAQKGIYKIWIDNKGIYFGDYKTFLSFSEGKWVFLESEKVYTIKNGYNVFCIPKYIFKNTEEQVFVNVMNNNNITKIKVKTRKGEADE